MVGATAAATLTTGSNNTIVGRAADCTATAANCTSLGNAATCTADNQITLGNASIATLRCQQTSITALSDARFKRNIQPLDIPDEAFNELEIVTYEWILEDMPQGPQLGVIAQQLDTWQDKWNLQWLKLVDKTNPDRWEATPGKILFLMIQKTQRLSRRVANLEARHYGASDI